MKKKAAKRQIKRVRKIAKKWVAPLGLYWWNTITWIYHDGDTKEWARKNDQRCVMITTVRWEYLWAAIDVNLTACADQTDDQLEQAILHELAHILLAEVRDCRGLKHHERTCTRLAQVFQWIREAG